MKEFLAWADKEGVRFDEKGYLLSEKLIKTQMKALIAQKLWDLTSFYRVINEYDPEVKKALDVIRDDDLFDTLGISR
jgi:carboxyl-terminal processing protease